MLILNATWTGDSISKFFLMRGFSDYNYLSDKDTNQKAKPNQSKTCKKTDLKLSLLFWIKIKAKTKLK